MSNNPFHKQPHLTHANKKHLVITCAVLACLLGITLYLRKASQNILHFDTLFGKTRIYEVLDDDEKLVRLLEVDGIVQSGTYIDDNREFDLVFTYLKLYDLMFSINPSIAHVCVLGCGGFDYPEHLIATHPNLIVDAVELDPAIIALAQRYFYLDRLIETYDLEETQRLHIHNEDALEFLLTSDKLFDAIVNDTFDGSTPPAHLTTNEFYRTIKQRLAPKGIFLTNIVSPLEGRGIEFLAEQVAYLEMYFNSVAIVPCDSSTADIADNVVVIATDEELPEAVTRISL